jgi:hypothetical protein
LGKILHERDRRVIAWERDPRPIEEQPREWWKDRDEEENLLPMWGESDL